MDVCCSKKNNWILGGGGGKSTVRAGKCWNRGQLGNLHLWRHSKLIWIRPWAAWPNCDGESWPEQKVGQAHGDLLQPQLLCHCNLNIGLPSPAECSQLCGDGCCRVRLCVSCGSRGSLLFYSSAWTACQWRDRALLWAAGVQDGLPAQEQGPSPCFVMINVGFRLSL